MVFAAIMEKLSIAALLTVWLVGCGGEDENSFTCDPETDRVGTYVISYDQRANGTCGEFPDQVVRYEAGGEGEALADCEFVQPDQWSSDGCRLDRSIRCLDPETGFVSEIVAFTEQQDADGERITGTLSIVITDPFSGDGCASTYDQVATRQ